MERGKITLRWDDEWKKFNQGSQKKRKLGELFQIIPIPIHFIHEKVL